MMLGDIFVMGGYVILPPKIVPDIRPIRNDAEGWMVKVGDILIDTPRGSVAVLY